VRESAGKAARGGRMTIANESSVSAAKGGALGSTTEAERAHPYSLGIGSTVPSGDEGVCFARPASRERCG